MLLCVLSELTLFFIRCYDGQHTFCHVCACFSSCNTRCCDTSTPKICNNITIRTQRAPRQKHRHMVLQQYTAGDGKYTHTTPFLRNYHRKRTYIHLHTLLYGSIITHNTLKTHEQTHEQTHKNTHQKHTPSTQRRDAHLPTTPMMSQLP